MDQNVRGICESIAEAVATAAPLLESLHEERSRSHFGADLFKYFHDLRLSQAPLDLLFRKHIELQSLFSAHGMAYVAKDRADFAGLTPTKRDILELALWIREKLKLSKDGVFATDSLSREDERWIVMREQVSGLLAIALPDHGDAIFMMFRPELISRVVWGGDPRKLESRNYRGSINPRKSFEGWEETVRSHSEPWAQWAVDGVKHLKHMIFDALIQKEHIIRELRQKLHERQV